MGPLNARGASVLAWEGVRRRAGRLDPTESTARPDAPTSTEGQTPDERNMIGPVMIPDDLGPPIVHTR